MSMSPPVGETIELRCNDATIFKSSITAWARSSMMNSIIVSVNWKLGVSGCLDWIRSRFWGSTLKDLLTALFRRVWFPAHHRVGRRMVRRFSCHGLYRGGTLSWPGGRLLPRRTRTLRPRL
jgi:hypothetical protein